MSRYSLEDAKAAWARPYEGLRQEEIDQRVLGFAALVQGVARRGAISPEEFAAEIGVDSQRAKQLFEGLASVGVQVDDQGNVVGAALTARETPHRVTLSGREFYAWCALDTLFIPGLLGETAEVESVCPVSGGAVQLRVSPDCVESCEPPNTWVSVFLPGGRSGTTGPASPT